MSFIVLHIHLIFSKIRNIDNYQSIFVKSKFPLKDIIFYNTSLLWKKIEVKISQFSIFFCKWQYIPTLFEIEPPGDVLFLCILTCETQVHTCETQVHSCTRSATSGIPHPKFPKFCDIYILSLFLTKHL